MDDNVFVFLSITAPLSLPLSRYRRLPPHISAPSRVRAASAGCWVSWMVIDLAIAAVNSRHKLWISTMASPSQKRQQEDGKARSDGDKRRRFTNLKSVILEVIKLQSFQHFLEPTLVPLMRRVVKEELELALRKNSSSKKGNCGEDTHSESRSVKLQFLGSISLPIFTGARIEGKDNCAIKVAAVDADTGQIVESGPESSAKVQIVALEGDFDGDENNLSLEEFKNNCVRERNGKKPLIAGDTFLDLKNGIGLVGDISFTDNSSWTRSRKFRLGATVVDCMDGIRITEATTEPFIVRDHRGELYKKHHPPSLTDEIWRLEKIAKEGAFHKRLSKERIDTVKDFLRLLFINPLKLRSILGPGMSTKTWEVIVDHAQGCQLDTRLYLYGSANSQQNSRVAFNVVGQLMGLLLSDCKYVSVDKLPEAEKAAAKELILLAFQNWRDVTTFDDEASLISSTSHLPNASYVQQNVSSPDVISSIYAIGDRGPLDDNPLHGIADLGYDHPTFSFGSGNSNSQICDTDSMTRAFHDDPLNLLEPEPDCSVGTQNPSMESQADLHSVVKGFLLPHSTAAAASARRRWRKVSNVLLSFSVRKIAPLRKHK